MSSWRGVKIQELTTFVFSPLPSISLKHARTPTPPPPPQHTHTLTHRCTSRCTKELRQMDTADEYDGGDNVSMVTMTTDTVDGDTELMIADVWSRWRWQRWCCLQAWWPYTTRHGRVDPNLCKLCCWNSPPWTNKPWMEKLHFTWPVSTDTYTWWVPALSVVPVTTEIKDILVCKLK